MADKWIQLMSENGVDNLYPTSNMDLLWENASPTTSFSAQTISLDLSEYKYIYLVGNDSVVGTRPSTLIITGNRGQLVVAAASSGRRNVITRTSEISFEIGLTGDQTNNNRCIPYQVYGIK